MDRGIQLLREGAPILDADELPAVAAGMLGGLKDDEWENTLDWFGERCAYTDETLVDGHMNRDHAIPMNCSHCGLHLYGNLLPATRDANRREAGKHYGDFVEDPERLEWIESFVRESGYWERVSVFGDLQRYCEAQYRSIDALCRVNRKYLDSLLPEDLENEAGSDPEPPDPSPELRRDAAIRPKNPEPKAQSDPSGQRAPGHRATVPLWAWPEPLRPNQEQNNAAEKRGSDHQRKARRAAAQ